MQTPKQPTKVAKVKVPTKQERIDALLDEMINVKTAVEAIGDSDGSYQRSLDAIEAQLKELSE